MIPRCCLRWCSNWSQICTIKPTTSSYWPSGIAWLGLLPPWSSPSGRTRDGLGPPRITVVRVASAHHPKVYSDIASDVQTMRCTCIRFSHWLRKALSFDSGRLQLLGWHTHMQLETRPMHGTSVLRMSVTKVVRKFLGGMIATLSPYSPLFKSASALCSIIVIKHLESAHAWHLYLDILLVYQAGSAKRRSSIQSSGVDLYARNLC